jgi:hypothetical protein
LERYTMQFQVGRCYQLSNLKATFPTKVFAYSDSFWTNDTGDGLFVGPSAFSAHGDRSEFVSAITYSYRPNAVEEKTILQEDDKLAYRSKLMQMRLHMAVVHPKHTNQAVFLGEVQYCGARYLDEGGVLVGFQLAERIALPTWSLLGGFQGWVLFLKDNSRVAVTTTDDADRFLAAIRDSDESVAGIRYEEDRLNLFLEQDKGHVMYHASSPKADYFLLSDLPMTKDCERDSFWFFADEDPENSTEIAMRFVCSRELTLSCLREILVGQVPARMVKDLPVQEE